MKKTILFFLLSFVLSYGAKAQDKTGSFSCKVDGADWVPKDGQRYTGMLTYKIRQDTSKPQQEAILLTQENQNHDMIMMEIPYDRSSKAPIDGVKFSLTKGSDTYSALINHLELSQSVTDDGKKVFITGTISTIELSGISLDAKKEKITDLHFENIRVTLKMF